MQSVIFCENPHTLSVQTPDRTRQHWNFQFWRWCQIPAAIRLVSASPAARERTTFTLATRDCKSSPTPHCIALKRAFLEADPYEICDFRDS
jgi:hypothetical protein